MKTTIWEKGKKITIFIGGDPEKGAAPKITIEIDGPQIQLDSNKGVITILETK